MKKYDLPKDLQTVLGNEEIEFAVYANRRQPKSASYKTIAMSLVWLFPALLMAYFFLAPLIDGKEVRFKVNDKPVTASWDNLEPMLFPAIFIFLFIALGIGLLYWGIIMLTKKGGYFVGTKNRIIHYLNGNIEYFDWEQFTGNVELNFNNRDIALELRRGKMKSQSKNGPKKFIPETLHLSGIENLVKVEKICRERIKENDPNIPSIKPITNQ